MDKKKSKNKQPNLLFKKYLILSKIDEGSFGSIYLATNKNTNEKVAIKVENRKQSKPLLEREAYILFYLRGHGLPKVITFGKTHDYYILVQTLLGPSLSSLTENYFINFSIKDICMLSIQMIERLEYIHSKDFIHRDIKPQNFLMGLTDPNVLYIIDFGLSKKYRSKKGKHIKFSLTNNIIGTPRYCSINALRGAEQSRRDDLESLFYVILYFLRGNVPWQNLKIKSRSERFNKINEIKRNINYKLLCKNLPDELYNFGLYVKHLKFVQEPNYKYIKKLFYSILTKMNETDDDIFSWIKFNFVKASNSSHSHKNIFKEKPSVHKRLYEKIAHSLEKKISSEKNNLNLNNGVNSIKDNITLISLNIEGTNNKNINVKKSSSYAGMQDIRVKNIMNKNTSLINNKINIRRDYFSKSNNIYNRPIIKKNPTSIKIQKIGNTESNLTNLDFNSNYNESVKNIFLRNNICYTSPELILDIKKFKKMKNSPNILLKNKEHNHKIINRTNIIKKDFNANKICFKNKNNTITIKNLRKINNASNKILNNRNNINSIDSINNSINNSIKNINNNINKNKNNRIYHMHSYNKINLYSIQNLPNNNNIYRTNSTTFPVNKFLAHKNMNSTYKSITNRRNINPIMKTRSAKNSNINLNIKLINNNNYGTAPLFIYNEQSNKLNNIKKIPENKIIKDKCMNNLINQKLNKISNTKNININRIIKYKIQRKTIANNEINIENNDLFTFGDERHNNLIKIMDDPKKKNQLDTNFSLY